MSNRFDIAAATWDEKPSRVKIPKDISSKIKELVDIFGIDSFLDFGCGTGNLILSLVEDTKSKIIGLDSSKNMLEVFEKKCTDLGFDNVQTIHHDLDEFLPENEVGMVVSSMTLHHIEHPATLLKNLFKIVKNGGLIAIADLECEDGSFHQAGNDGVHHFGFSREFFIENLTAAGFCEIQIDIATTVNRGEKSYPILLAIAKKL